MSEISKSLKLFFISTKDSLLANKKSNKMRVLFPLFMIALYLLLFVVCFQYSLMFGVTLKEDNLEYVSLIMFYFTSVLVMFMMTSYKSRGALFGAKDTSFLLSLPISNASILFMRIMNMMMFNYFVASLLIIPSSISYMWFNHTVNWPFLFICLIFVPFIPTMLSCCVGCIIGFTISRSKHKSIIESVMLFGFMVVIFMVATNFGTILEKIFDLKDDVLLVFKSVYLPIVWMYDAVTKSDVLSLLLFVVSNVICLGIFIIFFNKLFVTINQRMSERYVNKNFKLVEAKQKNHMFALMIKELKLYTQSSMHMLNTCFGSVTIFVFAISTFFYNRSSILEAFSSFGVVIKPEEFVLAIGATMIALSCTTPASISMEGNSLWCLRSLPVKEITILYSKMLMDMCFIMPINIVSAIIIGLNFKVELSTLALIVVFMALVGASMTHFGIILNLLFPKLKFKTEVEVVKQSMAANLAVYIPIIILAISIVVWMVCKTFMTFTQFLLGYISIMAMVLIILAIIVRTYGVRKLQLLYC